MTEKVGRNDSCPCGSGKKYKACCMKKAKEPRVIRAKWVNRPSEKLVDTMPDLMERTFGSAIASAGEKPPALPEKQEE